LMNLKFEKNKLLALLLIGDLGYISLHLIYSYTNLLSDGLFSVTQDHGYAEFYQYLKELWILVLFFFLGLKNRNILFFLFSLLFLYFVLDDALRIHERVGAFLAFNLNFQSRFGLREVDFGELVVYLFVGVQFLLLLAAAFLHSDRYSKDIAKKLLFMLAILAFFGILVDLVQTLARGTLVFGILGLVDDGGELIVMSVITAFVFHLRSPGQIETD
jgi:hypothetical protein